VVAGAIMTSRTPAANEIVFNRMGYSYTHSGAETSRS